MEKDKYILAIESSCDETAAAVLERKDGKLTVLSMPASLDALRDAVRKYIS